MKREKRILKMDERQLAIQGKANGVVMLFLMICLCAAAIYRTVTEGETGWELIALLASFPIMMLARRLYGDVETPCGFKNQPLPTGRARKDRRTRAGNYAIEALFFAVPMALIDVGLSVSSPQEHALLQWMKAWFPTLNRVPLIVVSTLLVFAASFAISYAVRYLVTELILLKQYNRLQEKISDSAE